MIYAEGDVVDGKGEKDEIGSDTYRWLIRKARFDKDVKAIVIRVNSGWRKFAGQREYLAGGDAGPEGEAGGHQLW